MCSNSQDGLASGLGRLRGEDLSGVGTERLESELVELERHLRVVEAERLRRIAELDRRRAFGRDGHLSTAAWMADRLGSSFPAAARQVRAARALEEMPKVREALGSGQVSASAVRVLVEARGDHPDAFARAEPLLVQAARSVPVRHLQAAVARWGERVDQGAAEDRARRLRERRRLRVSPRVSGMVRVDGDLDPETGQTVMTALRAVTDPQARTGGRDPRTPDQRRADALGEVCRRFLDGADRPVVAGERPHVVVTVPLDALTSGRGPAHLEEAGPVPAEAARRIACDASVSRVVLSGRSEPLEVGRRTPVVPAGLRRAVVIRDRHCRFPGCDRPAPWCDAHHVRHWAEGGETNLSNLILLCRPHHGLAHDGFRVEMVEGRPTFRRPDGTSLEDRAPP